MAQPNNPQTPKMVAVGSPEFNEAVAAVLASLGMAHESEAVTVGKQQPVVIQPTSIDRTQPGPDDLTVRFTRFCTFQNSGYQKGQEAGFPRHAAEALQKSGAAFIVHDPRRAARAA